jgi:hypothetical protein
MGIVFGRTGIDASKGLSPAYEILFKSSSSGLLPLEVRAYPAYLIAECSPVEGGDEAKDDRFGILAKYIGVFGNPENEGAEAMAMTAPVVMSGEKISMTSPVVQSGSAGGDKFSAMAFILPSKYQSVSQAPKPTSQRVSVKAVPERIILCTTFNGLVKDMGGSKLQQTIKSAMLEPVLAPLVKENPEQNSWELARYHPPFTLPMFQKNEIWITFRGMTKAQFLKAVEDRGAASSSG